MRGEVETVPLCLISVRNDVLHNEKVRRLIIYSLSLCRKFVNYMMWDGKKSLSQDILKKVCGLNVWIKSLDT